MRKRQTQAYRAEIELECLVRQQQDQVRRMQEVQFHAALLEARKYELHTPGGRRRAHEAWQDQVVEEQREKQQQHMHHRMLTTVANLLMLLPVCMRSTSSMTKMIPTKATARRRRRIKTSTVPSQKNLIMECCMDEVVVACTKYHTTCTNSRNHLSRTYMS
jgi:hypothetical protein